MADIQFQYDWNIKSAEEEYRQALALNPNLIIARNQYAQLLAAAHRFEEALVQAHEADTIDPGSAPSLTGLILYYKRDYDAAEGAIRTAMNGRPDVASVHIILGRIAEARGRFTEALDEMRIASQVSAGGVGALRAQIVCLEALIGQRRDADRAIRNLQRE